MGRVMELHFQASLDLDHVGGCPRYAECCTEFGYCHPRESWEAGYFRDCNGESNGTPLPGSVIRLEAAQAAKGESKVTADILGISQEIWQSQVQKAVTLLTTSTSSSSSSSSSFSGSSTSSSSGSSISSDLIQQIILAIQPQVAQAVQSAVSTQASGTQGFSGFSSSQGFQSGGAIQLGSQEGGFSSSQGFQSGGAIQLGSQDGTFSSEVTSSSLDVSDLVALVVAQLTPQITAAVQSATV